MPDAEKFTAAAAVFARTASGQTLYLREAAIEVTGPTSIEITPQDSSVPVRDARIDEIRAREAVATPGHWGTSYDGKGTYTIEAHPRFVPGSGEASVNDGIVATLAGEHCDGQTYCNADFVARAREDIPYLLGRIAALEAAAPAEPAADALPIAHLQAMADNARHAIALTQAQNTVDATEHVHAIERLITAYHIAARTQEA